MIPPARLEIWNTLLLLGRYLQFFLIYNCYFLLKLQVNLLKIAIKTLILLSLSVYCFPWKREDNLMGAAVLSIPKVVCPGHGEGRASGLCQGQELNKEGPHCTCSGSDPFPWWNTESLPAVLVMHLPWHPCKQPGGKGRSRSWALHLAPWTPEWKDRAREFLRGTECCYFWPSQKFPQREQLSAE